MRLASGGYLQKFALFDGEDGFIVSAPLYVAKNVEHNESEISNISKKEVNA